MKCRWRLCVGFVLLTVFGTALLLVLGITDTLDWLRGWPSLGDPASAFAEPDKETWPRYVFDDEKGRVLKQVQAGKTFLVDHDGQVRHRFDRLVIDSLKYGEDYVFLTSNDVICRSRNDDERWAVSFGQQEWIAGGGLLLLPGGEILAFLYGRINDSGVQVLRICPQSGEQVWQVHCGGLRVDHSKYRHEAKVEVIKGKYLKVMSKASAGSFVELLDLQSGEQLARREFGREVSRHWLLRWLFGQ